MNEINCTNMINGINGMNTMNTMNIYVVNYKNEKRKQKMIQRYDKLNLCEYFRSMIFTDEVSITDDRLKDICRPASELRIWSIMLQHLDSVRLFIEKTNDSYCIICEDDIHISKKLKQKMPGLLNVFNSLNLEVLMLGYLLPFKIEDDSIYFPKIAEHQNLSYRRYENDIWGCQMYLISRKYGEYLLKTYTIEYALKDIKPYNPDWLITKPLYDNRALLYPMLALEEGENLSDDIFQNDFHKRCHQCHITDEFL